MRIAIDSDGILSGFLDGLLDVVCELTGRRFQSQEILSWNPWAQLKLTHAQQQAVFDEIAAPGFCEALPLLLGAKEGFAALMKLADVYVVTSPWMSSPTWAWERANWVSRNLGLPRERVVSTASKHLVSADVFVDDHAVNVREWLKHNAGIGLLWDASHNRGIDLPRVHGWQELLNIVKAGPIAA